MLHEKSKNAGGRVRKDERRSSGGALEDRILHLQNIMGNQAVWNLFKSAGDRSHNHSAAGGNPVVQKHFKNSSAVSTHAAASGIIQRQSGSRICGQETLQIPVPDITATISGGSTSLALGPFSCLAGKCQVQQGSQAVTLPVLEQSAKDLTKSIRFSEDLIRKIPGYLKGAPASETYKKFIEWMHKTTGVSPAKPGSKPSAAVAAETTAFIDPTSIMSEWSQLGEISPPKGNDPIGNWISQVHEQHHQKTILTHPDVDKAYGEIRKSKASLLADQNMLAPYDQNLKSKADKEIPKHIQDESSLIDQDKQNIWKQINVKSGGRLNVVGMDKLLPLIKGLSEEAAIRRLMSKYNKLGALERVYYRQAALLAPKLKQYYGQYAQWFEKTRNFGKEDLKAYCLSWQAEKKALDFIKRCCPGIKSSPLRTRAGKSIRRMKLNALEPAEGFLQRLKDENFDDCDRERKKGEKDQITKAHDKAIGLLTHAVAELKSQPQLHHNNLRLIFGIRDVVAEKEKLQEILDTYLVTFVGLIAEKFKYECDYEDDWNLDCKEGVHAWTSRAGFTDVHICWDFFDMDSEEQAGSILHEALHKWPGLGDDQSNPFDNAYAYESFARSARIEPLR